MALVCVLFFMYDLPFIHQLPSLIFKGEGETENHQKTQQGHDIGAYLLVVMETRWFMDDNST